MRLEGTVGEVRIEAVSVSTFADGIPRWLPAQTFADIHVAHDLWFPMQPVPTGTQPGMRIEVDVVVCAVSLIPEEDASTQ